MKKESIYLLLLIVIIAGKAYSKDSVGKNDSTLLDGGAKWQMGVALYSFNKHPLAKALELANSSGVKYVEGFSFYNLGPDFNNKTMGDLDRNGLALIKQMLARRGLKMSSMYVDGAKNLRDWIKYFDLGRNLGVRYLVCEPPKAHWDMIDSLAGAYKIKIAIHEHSKEGSIYWHPDSVLAAIKGHQNIGACADLGHWVRSGLDPVKCLKQLAGHVLEIHLKDVDQSGNDVNLGTGSINFPGVIEELKRQRFNGPINMECEHDMENNLEDVKNGIQYFNGLAEKK